MRPKQIILLIDSNDHRMQLAAYALETRSRLIRVLTTTNRAEALQMLADNPVKVVVSQYALICDNGNDLLDEVKRQQPYVRTLLLHDSVPSCYPDCYADSFLQGGSNLDLLKRIYFLCARKRGPRKAVASAPVPVAAERMSA